MMKRVNLLLLASLQFVLILSLIAVACSEKPFVSGKSTSDQHRIELNVSAAASLTDALQPVNDLYEQYNTNIRIVANFTSSGTLQRQIEQGAPTDVFIPAAAKQMDSLQDGGLIVEDARQNLLNNKVVLIVPLNGSLVISDFIDLLDTEVKRVAIGDPDFVPAGTYGKEALEELGIYEKLKSKLILGSDVRQVLGYVESGNVDAGLVYSTDAAIAEKVKVVAEAPEEVNSKIVYPVAIIKSSNNPEAAAAYISFLFGDTAREIFKKYGFSVVGPLNN